MFSNSGSDPFEELSNLNTQAYDEGYQEGTIDGKKAAFESGFKIGKTMAFAVGKELGECYDMCKTFVLTHQNTSSAQSSPTIDKSLRLATQILELIEKFDFEGCHSDNFQTNINFIKDKFKQFCSLNNLRSYYSSNSELNFRLANNPKLSF